jgi:hypothetical protein
MPAFPALHLAVLKYDRDRATTGEAVPHARAD